MEKDYLKYRLWDTSLSEEERLEDLLQHLTLEEKFLCLGTGCPDIPRLGIRAFSVGGEGAHGVQARHDQAFDFGKPDFTTIFPNPIGMSASWDRELVKKAGRVTGTEARALFERSGGGGLCLWAPTIDMERDPRWGRTEEAYGEDPFLTGEMAGAYVQGIQGEDRLHLLAGATVKHFYANNVEDGRMWKSSEISERDKEEYYLEPFRRVIGQYGAVGLMTAYNKINGIPGILNPEVQLLAKEKWGLLHAVSDGGAMLQTVNDHHYFREHAETVAAGLKAGIDCFTDDLQEVVSAAKKAYQDGMITEKEIDRALFCHFRVMLRLGLFDPEEERRYRDTGMEKVGCREHLEVAKKMASEAAVLLKNDRLENGETLLPLDAAAFGVKKKLAVIGPLADVWYKDWYSGLPVYSVTPLEGIRKFLPADALIVEKGLDIVRVWIGSSRESEEDWYLGISRDTGALCVCSVDDAEPFEVEWWTEKDFTLRSCSNGKLVKLEDDPENGKKMRKGRVYACSDECFGWYAKEVFSSCSEEFFGWHGKKLRVDSEGFLCMQEEPGENSLFVRFELIRSGIMMAEEAAREAEACLVFAGANPIITCKEEVDRTSLELSPHQEKLLRTVYQENEMSAMVLLSSVPFSVLWENEHYPAILYSAIGGMELGNALAEHIFGITSPAGRLPLTWYRSEKDLPDMDDYSVISGERTYQYFKGEVLYPFGHGLTYGDVIYEEICKVFLEDEKVHLSVKLGNRGTRTTDEVVQVYVRKCVSGVKRPLKKLVAFERVHDLLPGEKREISLVLEKRDLCIYDVSEQKMLFEDGEYEIMAGASSGKTGVSERIFLS